MAESFKYGNGVWATKTGSSMAYNDENGNYKPVPFSVTRDSIATRVNKQGLIEVVGKDKLRIDYTDTSKGVALLEPSRTNLYPYSNQSSAPALNTFSAGTSTISITNDYGISPDGTQNAMRFQATCGSTLTDRAGLRDLLSMSATDATLSFYGKSNTGSNQTIAFHFIGGTQTVVTLTNEWQRFTYTNTSNTSNYAGVEIRGTYTDRDVDVLLFGFQMEQASYATSYIPTSGSTVQRAADVANGAGNSEVFNDSEGVLYAEIAALTNVDAFRQIAIGNSTDNVKLLYTGVSTSIRFIVKDGGVNQYDKTINVSDINFKKVALKYKASDFAVYIDGFEYEAQASGTTPSGLAELAFDDGGGGSDFYGKTKRIGYFDAVLTDAELEALTSYTSFINMANELNLTIK